MNPKYTFPIRFTAYSLSIAIVMLAGYYCLALWYEKNTGKLDVIIPVLGGILTGLLVPTRVNGASNQ